MLDYMKTNDHLDEEEITDTLLQYMNNEEETGMQSTSFKKISQTLEALTSAR